MSRTDLRPDDTSLPARHKVEGVTVCGLLSALRCELWYRRQSLALTNSPAPWDPALVHLYVLEVDFVTLDRDDPDLWIWVTISWPTRHEPGSAGFFDDIRRLLLRAVAHEVDEGLLVAGDRRYDPHAL